MPGNSRRMFIPTAPFCSRSRNLGTSSLSGPRERRSFPSSRREPWSCASRLVKFYLVSSSIMDYFIHLDALDSITLSGTRADGWYLDEAKAAMEAGEITYAGKYSAPDYECILAAHCSLAIENTMIYHTRRSRSSWNTSGCRCWWSAPVMRAAPLPGWSGSSSLGCCWAEPKRPNAFQREDRADRARFAAGAHGQDGGVLLRHGK